MIRLLSLLGAATLFLPTTASAQVLVQAVGIFNIFVGLMLVVAVLVYFGSLVGWYIRRGVSTGYRDEMIALMQWPVVILFVLLIMLALIRFVQHSQGVASFVLGLFLFFMIAWVALQLASASAKGGEKEH